MPRRRKSPAPDTTQTEEEVVTPTYEENPQEYTARAMRVLAQFKDLTDQIPAVERYRVRLRAYREAMRGEDLGTWTGGTIADRLIQDRRDHVGEWTPRDVRPPQIRQLLTEWKIREKYMSAHVNPRDASEAHK